MSKEEKKNQKKEIELDNKIIKEGYLEVKNTYKKEKSPKGSDNSKIKQYYL